MHRPTRTPRATSQEREEVAALPSRVWMMVEGRDRLRPGESMTVDGIEFSREQLDHMAEEGREHLYEVGCQAIAIARQIRIEKGWTDPLKEKS